MEFATPPKGISEITLNRVIAAAAEAGQDEVSAADVAESTGMSVVTARRYLRFLAAIGHASIACRYGKVGAPERLYRLMTNSAPRADSRLARSQTEKRAS